MYSLVLLLCAVGVSLSEPAFLDSGIQQANRPAVAMVEVARKDSLEDAFQTRTTASDTVAVFPIVKAAKSAVDTSTQGRTPQSRVKKAPETVKNSWEIALLELPDLNPLLTQILLYDPDEYRVFPREPRVVEPDEVLEYFRAEPLFLPLVFGAFQPNLRLTEQYKPDTISRLISARTNSFLTASHYNLLAAKAAHRFMLEMEVRHLPQIKYELKDMPNPEQLIYFLQHEKPLNLDKPNPYSFDRTEKKTGNLPLVTYNPWRTKGNYKLHFSETHVSPNWSKGGESNMAGLASIYLEANYNNRKNVQYDNNLEIKIGMNTVPSDSLRNLNVSTDQVRATSKLGIRMFNNWYYSLSTEFMTQMLNNYKKNTMVLKSSLLSPAKLYVSLGVDFKKADNKKGYNLSVMLSPATYKLNYLYDNVNLRTAPYGIEAGKHFGSEIGSKVSFNLNWRFSERINWKSKMYYFTDYTYLDTEWENTLDIMLNHYFSTQFFVLLKVDDRMQRQNGGSLLQLQQLLSFGMTYFF